MAPSSRCGWEGREPTNSPDPAIVVRRGSWAEVLFDGGAGRWRRGRRSSHRTHPFIAVKGIARVVRGLEDIDLSVMTLRRRNQKAVLDPLSVLSPRL